MSIVLLRSLILYILVIFAVRLMGKRQLGELQPSELVITILVSNIATLPLEDVNIPLIVGITPILSLVCFEVIVSWLSMKCTKLRKVISGHPKIIISGGVIDRRVMRDLRFSVDDLMTALRGNGIFRIEEVQFAIVETTGSISVMKKSDNESVTRIDMNITGESSDPPQVIISDGKISERALSTAGMGEKTLKRILRRERLDVSDVLIMTADSSGRYYIADKRGNPPKIGGEGNSNDKS
ncbi:MAG: DUF421 domain-containing protein [Ruminococcus sp.]|nr:DUF421 domain-containing protein [Ruminococcus sp.]